MLQFSSADESFFYPKGRKFDVVTPKKVIVAYLAGQFFNGVDSAYRGEQVYQWSDYRITSKSDPNWKELKARGTDVTTNLDAFRRLLNVEPNGFTQDFYYPPKDWKYCLGPLAIVANGWIPIAGVTSFDSTLLNKATDQARINFTKSYRKAKSTWMSGQFIGELAETVRFLKSPAKSLMSAAKDLVFRARGLKTRASRFRTSRRYSEQSDAFQSAYLKAATDSWLAYKYAATPLANDIRSGYDAYQKLVKNESEGLVRIFGSAEVKSDPDRLVTLGNYPSNPLNLGGSEVRVLRKAETTVQVRMRGAFRVTSGKPKVWDAFGLSPDLWIPTVYEVIPFSFVADYFSNLGDVIDTMSFEHLVYLAWQNKTYRQIHTIECLAASGNDVFGYDPWGATPWPATAPIGYGGRVLDVHTLVQRRPGGFTDFSAPSARLTLPSLGQSLNLAALVNSITSVARMP